MKYEIAKASATTPAIPPTTPPTMGPVFDEDDDSGVGDAGRDSLEGAGPEVAVENVPEG